MSRRSSTAEKQIFRTTEASFLGSTQERYELSDADTLHIPLRDGFVVHDTGEMFPVPQIIKDSDPLSRLGKAPVIPMPIRPENPESGGFLRRIPGASPGGLRKLKIMSIAFTLAVAASFLGSYAVQLMSSKHLEKVQTAAVTAPAQEIVVSAEDPAVADTEMQAGAITVTEKVFDPASQTSILNIDLGERALSFVGEPRLSGAATGRQPLMQQSYTPRMGLHPRLNAERFTSPSGLEWQGAWELNNPRANLNRAEKYSRYLEDTFKRNMNDSLVAQRSGAVDLSSGFDASRKAALPALGK